MSADKGGGMMATCKDCFHVDICEHYAKTLNQKLAQYCNIQIPFEKEKPHSEPCEFFKDRSRFVELPCKHGDTLFRIKNGKIEKGVATTFFYGSEFQIVNCRFPKISTGIPFHRFGKTVFLTREEAEQALKERENNVQPERRLY